MIAQVSYPYSKTARERIGVRCGVCDKYGAQPSLSHDWNALKHQAVDLKLTLKYSASAAIHDKCAKQLSALIEQKRRERKP